MHLHVRYVSCTVLLRALLISWTARADDPPVIQLDPNVNAFSSLLPCRAPFILDVPAAKNAVGVDVRFWEVDTSAKDCKTLVDPIHLSGKPLAMAADATVQHFQVTLPMQQQAAPVGLQAVRATS